MPRTETKSPSKKPKNDKPAAVNTDQVGDVLTLAEAAAYLRVPESAVADLTRSQGLPSRRVGDEWRFLKSAIQDWLAAAPDPKKVFWETHFGALKDDPYLEELLKEIYKRRGRPETEES